MVIKCMTCGLELNYDLTNPPEEHTYFRCPRCYKEYQNFLKRASELQAELEAAIQRVKRHLTPPA